MKESGQKLCPMALPLSASKIEIIQKAIQCKGAHCGWFIAEESECAIYTLAKAARKLPY